MTEENRNDKPRSTIGIGTNILMLIVVLLDDITAFLYSPESDEKTYFDLLFDKYSWLGAIEPVVHMVILLVSIVLGIWVVHVAWNRFLVTHVPSIRKITLQEAIFVGLVGSLFFYQWL